MVINMIEDLKRLGFRIPEKETNLETLTAKQILEKVESFYVRLANVKDDFADLAEGYFLQLMREYSFSMCSYSMTETLKLIIALAYFESKPTEEQIKRDQAECKQAHIKIQPWSGYSFDELALVFDRSKASIHAAILQKETEAKELLRDAEVKRLSKKAENEGVNR